MRIFRLKAGLRLKNSRSLAILGVMLVSVV